MVEIRSVAPEEVALLDVTQRLARQLEQQLAQVRGMRGQGVGPVADTGLGELESRARRMQRDGERLRLLCGADLAQSPADVGPTSIADVLSDAVAATAAPARVTVRPAPIASVGPPAGAELGHVLAEVLDAALADSALGITVGGRLGPAGLTVDVMLDGPRRITGPSAAGVADALARRSGSGIQVHRSGSDGPYAIVLCPATVLTVPLQRMPVPTWAPGMREIGVGATPSPLGTEMFGVRSNGSAGGTALFGSGAVTPARESAPRVRTVGNGRSVAPPVVGLFAPSGPVPSTQPQRAAAPFVGDPLFGPLPPSASVDTPIYEDVVSAWFREDDGRSPNGSDVSWDSPGDLEWRTATARAAASDEVGAGTTASGLPRRRPGRQMVTPPLPRGRSATAEGSTQLGAADERQPLRVRDRLDDYQRGLRQGRHRASEPEPPVERVARRTGA